LTNTTILPYLLLYNSKGLSNQKRVKTNHMSPLLLFHVILFLTCVLEYSYSYNVYNYDLTTPLFTPDGLLKQVEYASATSTHCAPILVVPLIVNSTSHDGTCSTECVIIIATMSSLSNVNEIEDDKKEDDYTPPPRHTRGQSRIVEMPITSQSNSHSGSGSGTSLVFGLNGLLPDCVSLLQHAREQLYSYQKAYGVNRLHPFRDGIVGSTTSSQMSYSSASSFASASSCALRVARSIADRCQEHSFGGGLRSFGSQIVVCGVDRDIVNIFVTDASGAVNQYSFGSCISSGNSESDCQFLSDVIVVGGDVKARDQVQRFMKNSAKGFNTNIEGRPNHQIQRALVSSIRAFLDVYAKDSSSSHSKTRENAITEEMDVVIFTSRHLHRLKKEQILQILEN